MQRIFTPEAMLAEGWSKDVVIDVDDRGGIAAVRARQVPGAAETAGGPVIPGMANVHSHAFQRAMAGLADRMAPIHIHLAEQIKEVNDCLTWSGQRPVEWLLSHMPVDPRWCLAHCTNISQSEAEKLSASGAAVGLCPTTEGNLGDGIFPFPRFRDKRGRWGIGGDSHVSQTPVEELRWLEYVQRLAARRRNIAASPSQPSVGATLWREAAAGGAQALARPMGAIAPGVRADLVVLDTDHINLVGRSGDRLLDAFLFAGDGQMVRHVMVGGKWVVRDGRHADEAAIAARYRQVQKQLYAAL